MTVSNYFLPLFFFFSQTFLCSVVTGQQATTQTPSLINVIPPSPTAAALGKYGEIPVSLYTGVPNISIPLYEIQEGDIKLPISLSYHASGIKVEEVASNVGLGWSLNAGGVITRTVRGADDDGTDGLVGYFQAHNNLTQGLNPATTYGDFLNLVERGQIDGEPDIYNYNFVNYSGKFLYDRFYSDFYSIPLNKLKIQLIDNSEWKITDKQGIIYEFIQKEIVVASSTCFSGNTFSLPSPANYTTTAWYLSKIISPTGNILTLNYTPISYVTYSLGTEVINLSLTQGVSLCQNEKSECTNRNQYNTYQLSSIEGSFGKVNFIYNNPRQDLMGEKMLDFIQITNLQGVLLKKIKLEHDYFYNNNACNESNGVLPTSRLKLISLLEEQPNGVTQKYSFEYDATPLPHTMSRSQDYWGYYNGVCNNSLIPSFDYLFIGREVHFGGAVKSVRPEYTQACILKKITYPTGGFTEFEYENNKVKPYINTLNNSNDIPFNLGYEEELKILGLDKGNDTNGIIGVYSKHFTLPNITEDKDFFEVSFEFTEMGCPYNLGVTNCSVVSLVGDNGYAVALSHNNVKLRIPEGNYILQADFHNNPNMDWLDFYIRLKWWQPKASMTNIAGGLRIKRMLHYTSVNTTPKTQNYDYISDNGISSGSIIGGYKYEYRYTHYKLLKEYPDYTPPVICEYIRRLAHSLSPLATSQGSYVGYEKVTVYENNSTANGKTESYFSPVVINPNNKFWLPPYPPMLQKEWEWGLPLEVKSYKIDNQNTFKLIKHIKNTYKTFDGVKRNCEISEQDFLHNAVKTYRDTYSDYKLLVFPPADVPYTICSEYKFIANTETINFSTTTDDPIIQKETKDYSISNLENNITTILTSKKNKLSLIYTYVPDYTFTSLPITQSFAKGIKLLQDKHIIVPVIEQLQVKEINGQNYVVAGQLVEYHADKPLQKAIWVLELDNPVLESQFVKSKIDANNNFVYDSRYVKRIDFEQYDTRGNLLQQRKTGDVTTSYLWGYNQTLPVAQVVNAATNEVFYTSFETEAFTGIQAGTPANPAKTGSKYFTGSYQPAFTAPNNRKYILSYFVLEGGAWKYIKEDYTPNRAIQGTIDEVRIYPADAVMSTMTYTPLIGKTSETDANGITTYYEYDSFNRLYLIRDDQRNIVQKIDYKYYND
jgi:YD repeat-containing protein